MKKEFQMRSAVIFNFLIEANIMASIAILLMIPLRKCFREPLGNGALCFGWLLVALRLVLPLSLVNPLIHEIRSPYAADEAIRPIAGQIKVRVTDAVSDLSNAFWRAENREAYNLTRSLSDRMYNASLSRTLVNIWLAGMVLAAAWFLFVNIRFRLRLRTGRIEPISGDLLDRYRAICSERGVRPVPVYYTDPLPSACLVGVFRPYIALPLSASPQDAVHVLTHEVCHLKNRDHWWNVLRLICCAVHWFNPLVWLAASMSRTDSELRCDDRVTQPMDEE
jgi:beta-lactamase regulating signal transducer with metallopeptidase domain